jgi:hypothetical protein
MMFYIAWATKKEQGCGHDKDFKKIQELSKTTNDHGKKMVSVTKIKTDQHAEELSYTKEAEAQNSICTLSSEKRQLMIQMHAERIKKNKTMEQLLRLTKSWTRRMRCC